MNEHRVKKGTVIKSKIKSRIWIDIGETFTVEGIVKSEYHNGDGALFIDRNGGERVFWKPSDYEIIE